MIYVIVGPTGVGKSSLSERYALKHNAIIVNGDAFQCYREMEIGTAKPTKEELSRYENYLFNIASVDNEYTIFDYQKDLRSTLDKLLPLGRDIVIVGGSGLYLKSALYDFEFNEVVNHADMTPYEHFTNEELYAELLKIDPQGAENIHPNNRKRVLRAIQIYLESGETKSNIIAKQEHKPIYDVTFVGLSKDSRDELYSLINHRVDIMVEHGLFNEVHELLKTHSPDLRAFLAIGYKEIIQGEQNNSSQEEIINAIKQNTRNYAKRQYTYFKHQLDVKWFINVEDAYAFMEGR